MTSQHHNYVYVRDLFKTGDNEILSKYMYMYNSKLATILCFSHAIITFTFTVAFLLSFCIACICIKINYPNNFQI